MYFQKQQAQLSLNRPVIACTPVLFLKLCHPAKAMQRHTVWVHHSQAHKCSRKCSLSPNCFRSISSSCWASAKETMGVSQQPGRGGPAELKGRKLGGAEGSGARGRLTSVGMDWKWRPRNKVREKGHKSLDQKGEKRTGERLRRRNYFLTRCLLGECLSFNVALTKMAKGEDSYPRGWLISPPPCPLPGLFCIHILCSSWKQLVIKRQGSITIAQAAMRAPS